MAIIGEIRKRSWIAVVVVGVALLAFIIGDFGKRGNKIPTNVGIVDGEKIPYVDYNAKLTERENMFKQQNQRELTSEERYELQNQLWNELVETHLYEKQYAKLGLVLSHAELNDMFYGDFVHPYVRQSFTDPATGIFNAQMVVQYINNYGNLPDENKLQWHELEEYVKKERLSSKYGTLIAKSFYTPMAMAKHLAKIENQSANVTYVKKGYNEIPDANVKLTDADYQKYYDEHKEQFKQEASRDLEMVIFPVAPTPEDLIDIQKDIYRVYGEFQTLKADEMAGFVSSESDKRFDTTYYRAGEFKPAALDSIVFNTPAGSFIAPMQIGDEWIQAKVLKFDSRPDSVKASQIVILSNKASQQIARTDADAKKLADSLLAELKKQPELFAQYVSTYSDDPQTKEKGGDLGWMSDKMLANEIGSKIVASNAGDIFVEKIPNDMGYFIVAVTGKTASQRKAQVALITRKIEASNHTNKQILNNANLLASQSRTIQDLEANAKKGNYSLRNADFVAEMAYQLPGLSNARSIIRWAFNKETKIGDVAPEVFMIDDKYVVVALKDIKEKGYATLEQVKTYIENPVKIDKKAEILIADMDKALAGTKEIGALAAKLQKPVDTVADVTFGAYYFGENGPEMSVIGKVAAMKQGEISKPIKGYNAVYVVKTETVSPVNPPKDAKMVALELEMQSQQKLRQISSVLREKGNVEDHRSQFNY